MRQKCLCCFGQDNFYANKKSDPLMEILGNKICAFVLNFRHLFVGTKEPPLLPLLDHFDFEKYEPATHLFAVLYFWQ